MLTKTTDFTGLYYVPNAIDVAPDSNLTGNSTELTDFIAKYEVECLDMLLGYELSQLLQPELLKKPFDPGHAETADDKWVKLANGDAEYRGLRECIIAYVFYKFYQNDHEQYTGIGTKKLEANNTVEASVRPRAIKAWRQLYDLAIGKRFVRTVTTSIFGAGIIHGEYDSVYTSLYTYLSDNDTVYPEWVERSFLNKTQHGL